jgi:hypothetical protein
MQKQRVSVATASTARNAAQSELMRQVLSEMKKRLVRDRTKMVAVYKASKKFRVTDSIVYKEFIGSSTSAISAINESKELSYTMLVDLTANCDELIKKTSELFNSLGGSN